MTNRLAECSSPYLLEHAQNPVDWYPWGDEPFERALADDKPVLVSIGYSACHWCHVMAHESFENESTARLMNEQFVNIKVDREERPDVDAVYMAAVQTMTGQGGWPLNVFVTHDRRPFFGGTYFPPLPRHGLSSWPQLLQSIAMAWRGNRGGIEQSAASLLDHLKGVSDVPAPRPSDAFQPDLLEQATRVMKLTFDRIHGGFGSAPKFPSPMNLSFLLRSCVRAGDREALDMAVLTLDHMAAGGIHDHIGGGFHRYSVDESWLVPHFEKMLYDNALLGQTYTEAWQATQYHHLRSTAEGIFDYILRDLTSPEGAFYSSEDADSDGEEGNFYVWTVEEIRSVLGSDTDRFLVSYVVPPEGNFEGKTILTLRGGGSEDGPVTEDNIRLLAKLREARESRARPRRDTKILADWNALMIGSLARAGRAFQREDYREAATTAGRFLHSHLWHQDGGGHRLSHVLNSSQSRVAGFLADYGFVLESVLDLFEASGDEEWLDWATELGDETITLFSNPEGGFFSTSENDNDLPVRRRDFSDDVVPSGTSSAGFGLLRLARLTAVNEYEQVAVTTISQIAPAAKRHALSFGHLLAAIDFLQSPRREVVIVSRDGHQVSDLAAITSSTYLPNVVQITVTESKTLRSSCPLLMGKAAKDGDSVAYVCEGQVCSAPISKVEDLMHLLLPASPSSEPG